MLDRDQFGNRIVREKPPHSRRRTIITRTVLAGLALAVVAINYNCINDVGPQIPRWVTPDWSPIEPPAGYSPRRPIPVRAAPTAAPPDGINPNTRPSFGDFIMRNWDEIVGKR